VIVIKNISVLLLWLLSAVVRPAYAETSEFPSPPKISFWDERFIINGELRQETAFRVAEPFNFSKIKNQARLDLKFNFNDHFKLKISGRAWFDAVYDLTDQYPEFVKDDMRTQAMLRDTYLDILFPDITLRIGRQQIVWGEALGQFFADVVTPKDLREFFLPNFEYLRIPIWALDVQYQFLPGANLEVVLTPDMTVNRFALPGADFAFHIPTAPGIESVLLDDHQPDTNFKRWNAGARISALFSGWDVAGFYYTSLDHIPGLAKSFSVDPFTGNPLLEIEPIHERIHNFGATVSKSIGDALVARGEFVYTTDRLMNSTTPTFDRGLVRKNLFRYVLGVDYSFLGNALLNGEFQQEVVASSHSDLADQSLRSWVFLRFQKPFLNERLTPQLIVIVGLDGFDTMLGPRLSYDLTNSIQFLWGADFFTGPADQLYGQFDGQDRVFMNTQWRF
jgi:hypothetical protein